MEIDDSIMLTVACIGQLYGIYYSFVNWNNKDVDGVDIFYALTAYWMAAIFLFCLLPILLLGLIIYFIDKIRNKPKSKWEY